jgi:tRNA U34 5-methylaminomethyl-2-thiouridine-forming methyltransferase MnmC
LPTQNRTSFSSGQPGLDWLITDDGSRTLRDNSLKECYHSGCGAVSESWIVYVRQSGVERRLAERQATHVLEYGLGTGTTLLLTAAMAEISQCELSYVAFENRWLPSAIISELRLENGIEYLHKYRLLENHVGRKLGPTLRQLQGEFSRALDSIGDRERAAETFEIQVELGSYTRARLLHVDASRLSTEHLNRAGLAAASFNAVYFDAFAPSVNPEMWRRSVLEVPFALLKNGGTLSSYCVKGSVRRELNGIGFDVRCVPGPPEGKREVLLAFKPSPASRENSC